MITIRTPEGYIYHGPKWVYVWLSHIFPEYEIIKVELVEGQYDE